MRTASPDARDWQRRHYAAAGKAYGQKHFTRRDGLYTAWILERIAAVRPDARAIAEVGAGTCVFASLLGKRLNLDADVVCYEPVAELLEGSADFDNVRAMCGDALDFARSAGDDSFDLVFTKDTAHHFDRETLDRIHGGICRKLRPGGRYLMIVRKPPRDASIPVGRIAEAKWGQVFTPLGDLLASMRRLDAWDEIEVTRWQLPVRTRVREWIDGVENRDSWSIFSALNDDEIEATVGALERRFAGMESFDFLHQYNVAVFEKAGAGRRQ